jgi:hypothetical protein
VARDTRDRLRTATPPGPREGRTRRAAHSAADPGSRRELGFPPELDPEHYRDIHADLRSYSLEEAAEHYRTRGKAEGRQPNALATREMFRDLARGLGPILEIGPGDRSLFTGNRVTRLAGLDRQSLAGLEIAKNAKAAKFANAVPSGDHPWNPPRFAVIASSRVIEHQPDLVRHLRRVERVLQPGGYYFLWIPDKRYCLDHFQAESTIADVIEAAAEARVVHTLGTLIAQDVLRTHNDPRRHWRGDHGVPPENPAPLVRAARALYDEAHDGGESIDRHAWRFTPASFRAIVELLNELELTALRPLRVYHTLFPHNEFWAILQKH